MKILFASDIHGSAYYCKMLMERINEEKPEKIILLGDLLYHGPRNDLPKDYAPKEVIAMLNGIKDKIVAVRGNCEAEVDQMVLDFDVMSTYKEMSVNGIDLFLTHGHHYNKENSPEKSGKFALLNGHFHIPEISDKGDFVYINTGSVSIPKENSPHSYLVLEGNTFMLKEIETGKEFKKFTF